MESKQDKIKIPYFKVLIFSAILSFGVLFVISFVIPFTVNKWVIGSVGNNDSSLAGSWISFWGSFLGGIVGMFAVISTTHFLISNQNKQHQELLEQQKNDVQMAADLNDKKERERYYFSFLIGQNEKIIELLIELRGIITHRVNLILSISHARKDFDGMSDLKTMLIEQGDPQELLQRMEPKIFERMEEVDRLKREETRIKTNIIEKLAELNVRILHLNVGIDEVLEFKKKHERNISEMYNFVNSNNFNDEFEEILNNYNNNKDNDFNNLLELYSKNLITLLEHLK
ncbi:MULTISPECIES: DUF456 domain-containing protein [Lysinibacillus]|uniref:DUF456 domain-containing protein n=1 Tax=Lysinibacillus TaxID=400634 RepID=UPI0004D56095|nr:MULTISPECIES: DUF456 domain-containing protein [Lysinibacillus]AJK87672.1 hypothetical protein HR49_11110 [Lysinibacillus fusiformis]KHK48762.1 hypothetical protein PI85_21710 [Lysinibacillus sp. A1]